jgi:hypothetical protein
MPVLVWLIFRTLSRRRVRLPYKWVNAEWDSMSTEPTQKEPTFTKISSFCVDSVDVESHSPLTQSKWSLTWRWLSWRGVRLRVNWVTSEVKIWTCRRIQVQNKKHSKALLFGLNMFDQYKNQNKKISCKCTFKEWCAKFVSWYHSTLLMWDALSASDNK